MPAHAAVTPHTLARARIATLDPRARRVNHGSFGFFDGIGDLVRRGPTGTKRYQVNSDHQGRPTGRLINETQSPG